MGFWDSVCSVVSGCIDVVSSTVSAIGNTLAKVSTNLLKVASPYLESLSAIVQVVSTLLNILKPEDKVEELGDRAIKSDKIPEDFDTTQEYINYLKDEVSFDKNDFDKLSKEEKLARSAIGTSIVMKAINEKKGFDISVDTWLTLAKLNQSGGLKDAKAEEFDTILNNFKDNQKDLENYVKGELEPIKEIEVGDKLVEMYQDLEPNLSKDDINEKVMKMEIGE